MNATAYIDTFLRNINWEVVLKRIEAARNDRPLPNEDPSSTTDMPSLSVEELAAQMAHGSSVQIVDARHGFDVGRNVTKTLIERGFDARFVRGGIAAWYAPGTSPDAAWAGGISIPAIRRRRFDVLLVMALIQEPGAPRCNGCQDAILDRDLVLRLHGDWYHVRCVRTRRSDGASNRPPVVLCAICGTGIDRVADVVMTDSGPKHHWCRPVVEAKRDAGADRGRLRLVTGGLDATDR